MANRVGEVNGAGVGAPCVFLGSLPVDESYQEMGLALALLYLCACILEKENSCFAYTQRAKQHKLSTPSPQTLDHQTEGLR